MCHPVEGCWGAVPLIMMLCVQPSPKLKRYLNDFAPISSIAASNEILLHRAGHSVLISQTKAEVTDAELVKVAVGPASPPAALRRRWSLCGTAERHHNIAASPSGSTWSRVTFRRTREAGIFRPSACAPLATPSSNSRTRAHRSGARDNRQCGEDKIPDYTALARCNLSNLHIG